VSAFTDRITFLIPGERNPANGATLPPSPFGERWSKIRALQGQELYKAQQIAQTVSSLVKIRFERGITENMIIQTSDGRMLQIKAAEDPDNRGWELWLYCAEVGQNAGQTP
jgi:SPP1 family predicted phage head-tail adaptor